LELVNKGAILNKERDSLILKDKKEKDYSSSFIDSAKNLPIITN
jgi:hypothetical protein